MKPKVMLPTNSNEKRMMYSKSYRSIFMIGQRLLVMIQTKSFKKFFSSRLHKYQIGLEQSMKGRNFVFIMFQECIKYAKISINPGGTYVDSPKWIRCKKAPINK